LFGILANNIVTIETFKNLVTSPPTTLVKTFLMAYQHSPFIPIYEGYEDPCKHWFICEIIWEANDIIDEAKKMAQFAGALRK